MTANWRPRTPAGRVRDRPLSITHDEFQDQIRKLAEMQGWLYYHTYRSKRSPAGFPDVFLVRGQVAIAAELKVGRDVTTSDQRAWLRGLSEAGIFAALWRPDAPPKAEQWEGMIETSEGAGFGAIGRRLMAHLLLPRTRGRPAQRPDPGLADRIISQTR